MLKFQGPAPWESITKAAATPGPRYAAIAYVSGKAPDLLPLTHGDVLVVNASIGTAKAHITDPKALRTFINRGVKVYSCDDLHAKVIATKNRAVVGSANASTNSTNVVEASVITNDKEIIAAVTAFVENLVSDARQVTRSSLVELDRWWAEGTFTPIPGLTSSRRDPVKPTGKVFIEHSQATSREETKAEAKSRRQARKVAGPAHDVHLDIYATPQATGWKRGDGIYFVHTASSSVQQLSRSIVISADEPSGRPADKFLACVASPSQADTFSVEFAKVSLSAAGADGDLLNQEGLVRSAKLRKALDQIFVTSVGG